MLDITGSVVRPLNLSLTRMQYEQLLETIENIFKVPSDLVRPPTDVPSSVLADNIVEKSVVDDTDPDMDSFEINHKFKRRLFSNRDFTTNGGAGGGGGSSSTSTDRNSGMEPKVAFELPIFVIQLKNEHNHPLIEISFRDFKVNYEQKNLYETSVQVSLRSLLMEDLLQHPDSKHRAMVVSSSPTDDNDVDGDANHRPWPGCSFSSRSCPNLIGAHRQLDDCLTGSLPENLEMDADQFHKHLHHQAPSINKTACPDTPPPSPQPRRGQDNLVLYSSLLVDPKCPGFASQYQSMRQQSSVDFNSLDLVVSVQSWFVLLNFFGVMSDDDHRAADAHKSAPEMAAISTSADSSAADQRVGNSELDITVRSLTLVFNRPDHEIARANVSNAQIIVSKCGHQSSKTVEGKLGRISLLDLTAHGALYRERFLTTGNEALSFVYRQEAVLGGARLKRSLAEDASLRIQMSSVRYVHTKRFVSEIQVFFKEFQQLQTVRTFILLPNK